MTYLINDHHVSKISYFLPYNTISLHNNANPIKVIRFRSFPVNLPLILHTHPFLKTDKNLPGG